MQKLLSTGTNWFSTMKPVRMYLHLTVVITTIALVHAFNPSEEMFDFSKELLKTVQNLQEICDPTWISFKAEGEDDVRHVNVKTDLFVVFCKGITISKCSFLKIV